jgi:signal transduction histidine kinase
LLTIINDIIDISKIEARQLTLVKRNVSLHKLCDEIFATAGVELERLDKTEVQLMVLKGSENDIVLSIDEVRLKQVLYNLITNALKFTEQGTVKFGYTILEDKEIRFFVKDTGTGISPHIQGSIFDRFRQGDIDGKSRISGTGLGLAICKGIVELLDGKIGVTSAVGDGSEFFFTLPILKYLK